MRARAGLAAATLVAGCLAAGSCAVRTGQRVEQTDSASCAAVLEYAGHRYLGVDPVHRDPPLTERRVDAVRPGCDDTPGDGTADAVPRRGVRARALGGISTQVALALDGGIYVRQGRRLPPWTAAWFRPVRCTHRGTATLTGEAVDLQGPHGCDFRGLDRPYLLLVHVAGGPAAYRRTTLDVEADLTTRTAAGPVRARIICADGHVRARSVAPD